MNERSIFAAALDITDPAQRAAYLDEVCSSQPMLRRHIDELLTAQEKLGSFLAGPPIVLPGTSAYQPVSEGPGTRIGDYKLLQQIGEGGMGIVYMAEQEGAVRRKVALKIIKPGMDSRQVIARFEAERQALAMMDHQNIARVFDAGMTETGRPYFVMELVHGVPITKFCDDNKLTPRERLELFVPVCQAIQHAHLKGIIHRDVKPSNVLVTMYDDKPVPKVIDFGVAKAIEQRLTEKTLFTQFGALVGTFEYMSPEQAEMNAFGVDTRSDVYSLGVLLYELLTGTTPLEGKRLRSAALDELVRLIKEEEPPRPSVRLSSSDSRALVAAARRTEPAHLSSLVRGELDWIVMKCLEKDRTRRYETANSLARDIEHYLKDETVEACPPSAVYRLRKFARKHWRPLGVAAALAAVLMLGIAVTAWQAILARHARNDALDQRNAALANEEKAERAQDDAKQERNNVANANQQLMQARNDLQRALYAARINLAQNAWNAPAGVSAARELLDRHRPGPGEADLRGFEWHYLNRVCHTELRTFTGHTSAVFHASLSHDGLRLAAASWDGTMKVWDFQTGKELLSCKGKHDEVLDFSRNDRGLVVRSGNNVGMLDASTGKELWMRAADTQQVLSHVLSPDRRRLAAGGKDGVVKVWDLETSKEHLTLRGHTSWITGVAFSPDGQRLASVSDDQTVRTWDASNGRELLTLKGHHGSIRCVAFSPDGNHLASGSDDRTVRVWDAHKGRELFVLEGQGGAVEGVAFSPDGRLLGTSAAGIVKLWAVRTGRERYALRVPSQRIENWDFSPDSGRLVTAGMDRTIRVWDAQTGQELVVHRGHADRIHDIAFTPDGRRILSTSMDGIVKVWDVQKAPEVVRARKHLGPVGALAFASDTIGVAYDAPTEKEDHWPKGVVRIEDARTGREKFTLKGHDYGVCDLAFSPDGKRLASAGADQTVKVWDAQTGREVFALKQRDFQGTAIGRGAVVFSPDGRYFAAMSSVHKVSIWDARTGLEALTLDGTAWPLAYSPDGSLLACAAGETVKLRDPRTGGGGAVSELTMRVARVVSLAFSPDGRHLAGGTERDGIRLWAAPSLGEVRTLRGHTGSVTRLAFSPDGRRLASASADQTVKLWDPATGHELLTFTGPNPFTCVAFSPDGNQLIAACGDEVLIWDATPLPDERPPVLEGR